MRLSNLLPAYWLMFYGVLKVALRQRGCALLRSPLSMQFDYQLAFVTPGIKPFEAISRN